MVMGISGSAAADHIYVATNGTYVGADGTSAADHIQVYTYPPTVNDRGRQPAEHRAWDIGDRITDPDGVDQTKRLDELAQFMRDQQAAWEARNLTLEEKLESALHRINELERGSEEEITQAQEIEQRVVLPVLRQMGKRERIKTIATFVGKTALKAIITRIIKHSGIDLGWVLSLFT